VQYSSGSIPAVTLANAQNTFYWFGPWNSGLTANTNRSFRDFYWVDVDAIQTPSRLGSVRSSAATLSAASAPNYGTYCATLGGGAALSTAQSKFGGSALLVSSTTVSTNYVSVPDETSLRLAADFTAEFFMYPLDTAAGGVLLWKTTTTNSSYVNWSSGVLNVVSDNGTLIFAYTPSGFTNAWHHVAIVRAGLVWTLFVDGVQVLQTTATAADTWGTGATALYVGGNASGSSTSFRGYVDELRISNTARYTANFTAPTVAFSLDSNTVLLMHFDASLSGYQLDTAGSLPALAALNTAYSGTPIGAPAVVNAPSNDPLTLSFSAAAMAAGAKIVALDYRVAGQQSLAGNSLAVSLTDGTNTVNGSAVPLSQGSTQYGKRAWLRTTAPDGGSWTSAKVGTAQLSLTPQ
jgi:hypothetical protein